MTNGAGSGIAAVTTAQTPGVYNVACRDKAPARRMTRLGSNNRRHYLFFVPNNLTKPLLMVGRGAGPEITAEHYACLLHQRKITIRAVLLGAAHPEIRFHPVEHDTDR